MAWTPPEAHQLPEWRLEMLTSISNPKFTADAESDTEDGRFALVPHVDGEPDTRAQVDHHRRHISSAPLYWVDADLVHQAREQAAQPGPRKIDLEEAPSLSGLAVLGAPLVDYSQNAADYGPNFEDVTLPTPIVAVSWEPLPRTASAHEELQGAGWLLSGGELLTWGEDEHVFLVTFYVSKRGQWQDMDPGIVLSRDPVSGRITTAGDIHASTKGQWQPPLTWEAELPILDGGDTGPNRTLEVGGWMRPVQELWDAMSRSVLEDPEPEHVERSRAGRKRDARQGADSGRVRVVRMRSPRSSNGENGPGGGREYSQQWSVTSHKRNQCLQPRLHALGKCTHKRTRVRGYTKGPEDKPFKPSNRVQRSAPEQAEEGED